MYAIPCQGASLCWSLAHDISALWQQPENNGGRRTISQIRLRIWNLCGMEQAVKTEEVINTQTPRDAECPRPRGPVGFLPHSAPFLSNPPQNHLKLLKNYFSLLQPAYWERRINGLRIMLLPVVATTETG